MYSGPKGHGHVVQFGNITDVRGYCWCVTPGRSVHQTLHTRYSTPDTSLQILNSRHCTPDTVQQILNIKHCAADTEHKTLHCAADNSSFTPHTVHCTPHTVHHTLYTAHHTLDASHCAQNTGYHELYKKHWIWDTGLFSLPHTLHSNNEHICCIQICTPNT